MVGQGIKNKNEKDQFIFNTPSKTLDQIKYNFFHILNDKVQEENFPSLVGKIFDLMCGKQDNFYYLSLLNLNLLPKEEPPKLKFPEISLFEERMSSLSRNYFTYNIQFNILQ